MKKEPKVKEPKVKEPKTSKPSMFDKFKKSSDDGLDIITDLKEPFSFSGFFETHVVAKINHIKSVLDEHGIWFFLLSPFQARARLIAQLVILIIGVLFGVIPRASSLVSALQDQAYTSEIAGLTEKTVGSIKIIPAASSNYKRVHMLAFVVAGENLPSDASKYEVHLARSYGASDWADVTYSWTVYPVTDTERILLVAIDQSKQASGYGAFDLYVQLAGEDVPSYSKTPFEITLSTAQETTDLYDKTGIHLSALTKSICGSGKIASKQDDFNEALEKYQVALEQAEAMPIDINVAPTKDDLETYCLSKRIYRTLDDDSTTEDILSIDSVSDVPDIDYDVVITSNGIKYDKTYVEELRSDGGNSEEDIIRFNAFDSIESAKKAVTSAMDAVNAAAMSWYSTLTSYKLILNQTIKFDSFPLYARCTNTIEEAINFIDGSDTEPDDVTPGGLSSTVNDDDLVSKPVITEEPIVDEAPVVTEESNTGDEPVLDDEPVADDDIDEDRVADEPEEKTEESVQNEKPKTDKPYVSPTASQTSGDSADNK